jgi:hypothetical protein
MVEEDLAGMSIEELAEEELSFAERAERVRGRLTRNQAFLPPRCSRDFIRLPASSRIQS